ncbi:DUF4085 family protein [Metabacillus rhizolycopersici]|uniref:DUF4085 domain-containing protein n=1 Tax=Metabacillus rhizolycopersici TaxID=2875709 RepID=A0ABS7UWD7_9BACI|nr:DUF4085 family protein [Metabacillus rhizolycopersici]MBZ5752625.1 DUF4085 domain-containing protein [Metabacillus rhizolycopersici]
MWNLTMQAKKAFEHANILPIQESDHDWKIALEDAKEEGVDLYSQLKEELNECKERLLQILPERFKQYVHDGTLNSPELPKQVREDYLLWIRAAEETFEAVLDASFENKQKALAFLPEPVQEVYEQSLHDAEIERIERSPSTLKITLNTLGGFSTKSIVELFFTDIFIEESHLPLQVGQWYIYDELIKTENGFALHVIFDCPETEWTIEAKQINANYYYRPKAYDDFAEDKEFELQAYIEKLNPDFTYTSITPNFKSEIKTFTNEAPYMTLQEGELLVESGELHAILAGKQIKLADCLNDCLHFIFTDEYEDPYAQFSEPVPADEIEEVALSEDLELQVRAWNTMYANPHEFVDIINRVLMRLNVTEDNEMMASVYINHFNEYRILTEETLSKHCNLSGK